MNHKEAGIAAVMRSSDYAALRKLAEALWQQNAAYKGAAVMVGAGFSRSAASTGDQRMRLPLWRDLTDTLASELGLAGYSDPLRVAGEYCAYFGSQSLYDFIKRQINDAAWIPGEMHKSLLELPWSEVLTTNWDTLLERASLEVNHPVYSIVNKAEDLASGRSPRIVKLHGTLNHTHKLVCTQEDYRQYPQTNAAFVNFARHVFIENELCLVGFSGDDPNFLQWAGWVRDQLQMHARRIYLAGALNLDAPKRKYLESMNVAPIDLSDAVVEYDDADAKHSAALELFLRAIHQLRPKPGWEWTTTKISRSVLTEDELKKTSRDAGYAAGLLTAQLPVLIRDREAYPGWIVPPATQRWDIQNQLSDPYPTLANIAAMHPEDRAKLIYEYAWRLRLTYQIVPDWMAQQMLELCNPAETCSISKRQQLELALLILQNTRWRKLPASSTIVQSLTSIIQSSAAIWPDVVNELAYHKAICARDHLDYSSLEQYVDEIKTESPVWALRKAALLSELGRLDESEVLVAGAYRDLAAQYRKDQNSIYILSRLGWAHWLSRQVELRTLKGPLEPFPYTYAESKCSPWDHIEHVRERVAKHVETQQQDEYIEPLFEPGVYRDGSRTIRFSNELSPLLLLDGITKSVGVPLRWGHINFLADVATKIAQSKDIRAADAFSLAIRAANSDSSDVIKRVFSRTKVACLAADDANNLIEQCIRGVEFWAARTSSGGESIRNFAIERLRVFFEVLARISVRADTDQAKRIFRLAAKLGETPAFHHFWLVDSLGHLVNYSLDSIPAGQQSDVLLSALLFPLNSELDFEDHGRWPNPIVKDPGARVEDPVLDRRVDVIIESVAPCTSKSAGPLLRLLPLLEAGFLTAAERAKLAKNIWGSEPNYESIPNTGLFNYVLLKLPSNDPSAVFDCVRKWLFEAEVKQLFDPSFLEDLVNAARAEGIRLRPTPAQAVAYFDKLVSWRPAEKSHSPFASLDKNDGPLPDLIGEALACSIIPSLLATDRTEERLERLLMFFSESHSPSVLKALPHFAVANREYVNRVEHVIRQGLRDREPKVIQNASLAVLWWRDIEASAAAQRLTHIFVSVLGLAPTVGVAGMLGAANKMLTKGHLSDEDIASLVDVVPVIFRNADYGRIPAWSLEATTVSLVRKSCVRLANDLLSVAKTGQVPLQHILDAAGLDPLPEVRFAKAAA